MTHQEFPPFTLRRSRRSDLARLVHLGRSVFRTTVTDEQRTRYYAENPHLPGERVLVAERDGRLLGSAALLDFRMVVDGAPVPVDGVAAVAVEPTARRQGIADALVREALADAARRAVPYSLLYAFRGSYYRRFGYAPVEMGHMIRTAPRELPDSPERARVRPYGEADRAGVERCYGRWLAGRTGPLVRSDEWWRWRVLRDGQERVVYASRSGRIEGYALATLPEPARLGARCLRVQELVALHSRARRGLLGWLRSLGDEFSTVEVHAGADESWAPFLRDPDYRMTAVIPQQDATGHLGWGAMARITHLPRALAARRARPVRGAVTLEIDDPLLPANREPFTVRFGARRPAVRAGAHARRRLRAPADVLAQILLGAVSTTHARRFGMLEASADTAALLDAAWFGPPPFLGTLNEF